VLRLRDLGSVFRVQGLGCRLERIEIEAWGMGFKH
jgi:hypothetical protein